ncbi:MAG: leucine-rich repeat domain-containing protein [Pseudomonadota bacterium]
MSETEAFSEADRAAAYEYAQQRIAEKKAEGDTHLNLNPNGTDNKTRALTTLPREIAEFSELRKLFLSNTQVSDLSPLAGLSGLQELFLNNTQVSDLSRLAGLSGLQVLSLSNTQVRDLSQLAALSGLQSLHLTNTHVDDSSPLAGLTGLKSLNLDSTQISDLSPLAGLSELQGLYLSNTQVSDLSPLAGLSGLQRLHLSNTQVRDLSPIAGLRGLQVIGLDVELLPSLQGLDCLSRIRKASEEQNVPFGIFLPGTDKADVDPELKRIAQIKGGLDEDQERTLALLDYLDKLPPPAPPKPKEPEDDPAQIDDALRERPILRAATTTFVRDGDRFTAAPMPRDGADPTEGLAHREMLEALGWAAEELSRLAASNKIGQDEARRLDRYRQQLGGQPFNAQLLNLIARALRADLRRSIEEGGLKEGDAQIARDFLAAHRNLIAEFYAHVLDVPRLAVEAGMAEDVTPEQIAEPLRDIRALLDDKDLPITDEVRAVFTELDREAEARARSAQLEALHAQDEEERAALRRMFVEFATQAVGTVGRLYLVVRRHAVTVGKGAAYTAALGGGVASMDAAWNLTGKLAPYWHKLASYFSAIF